jgi:hypothetical protein
MSPNALSERRSRFEQWLKIVDEPSGKGSRIANRGRIENDLKDRILHLICAGQKLRDNKI